MVLILFAYKHFLRKIFDIFSRFPLKCLKGKSIKKEASYGTQPVHLEIILYFATNAQHKKIYEG
jgi:hypothetical protein